VEALGDAGMLTSLLGGAPGVTAQRFAVELQGGGSSSDILAAAEECGAIVVELREAP
jgi:hypothetical protein